MGNMYERILTLCASKGIKPGKVCADTGLSRGLMSALKMGRTKQLSAKTVKIIAEYFGVSTDYLISETGYGGGLAKEEISVGKYEGFVWDPIVNDPERQEAANKRMVEEDRRRAESEEKLCRFYQDRAEHRRTTVEIQATKYAMGAAACGVATYFIGTGGISWLAWILGIASAVLAGISVYGFGRIHEMNKHY